MISMCIRWLLGLISIRCALCWGWLCSQRTCFAVQWLKHVCFFPFFSELQSKCKKYPARETGAVLVVWERLLASPWFIFRLCGKIKRNALTEKHQNTQADTQLKQTQEKGVNQQHFWPNNIQYTAQIFGSRPPKENIERKHGVPGEPFWKNNTCLLFVCLVCFVVFRIDIHSGSVSKNLLKCPGVYTTYYTLLLSFFFFFSFFYYIYNVLLLCLITRVCTQLFVPTWFPNRKA